MSSEELIVAVKEMKDKYPVGILTEWIDPDMYSEASPEIEILAQYAAMTAMETGMAISAASAAGIEHDANHAATTVSSRIYQIMNIVYAFGSRDGRHSERESAGEGAKSAS